MSRGQADCIRGGLRSFESALAGPFLYLPHDAQVPGALTADGLGDIVAVLAGRSMRLEALVDGHNRRVHDMALKKAYSMATTEYAQAGVLR